MITFREFLLKEYEGEDDEMMGYGAERQATQTRRATEEQFENAFNEALVRIEEHGENPKKVAAFFARNYNIEYDALLDALMNTLGH